MTNKKQRLVAFVDGASSGLYDIMMKDDGAETWTLKDTFGINPGTNTDGVYDLHGGYSVNTSTNYRGKLYFVVASGNANNEGFTGQPGAIHSFDGTSEVTSALGGETLQTKAIASFIDRIFLGGVRAIVRNQLGETVAYDPTAWSSVTTTTTNLTNGSVVTGRITPTATTLSQIFENSVYTVAASTTPTYLNFRSDLRNTSPTYEMPLRTEIYYSQAWVADTAMTVGAIRVPATVGAGLGTGNGYRYRVTAVAGDTKTHAVTEPTWPTTIGTTVVDDQVTWICDGFDTISSQPITLPTLSATSDFVTTWTSATIPALPASASVGVRIKFGTSATPTIELAPIDISYKDGLADGAVGKANKGQQLTVGRFPHPFFNHEDDAVSAVDLGDIYWTDTSDPNSIDGNNYYNLSEEPGEVRAMALVAGRLVVFKKLGMWVFRGTDDPDNPLQLEEFFGNVGCVYEGALTVFGGTLYFLGEDGVYSFRPGGEPVELCGPAMREEIMADNSTGAYGGNTLWNQYPFVTINPRHRELYVNARTQTDTFHVLNLDTGAWSRIASAMATPFPNSAIHGPGFATYFHPTGNVYIGCNIEGRTITRTLHRMEDTSTGKDGAGSAAVAAYVTLRPVESLVPRREFAIDHVGVYHAVTGSQTNNTFEVQVSLDGGATFPKFNRVTFPTVETATGGDRFTVPVRQGSQRAIVRLYHAGDGGATMFNLSAVDVEVRELGPSRNLTNPTQGTATL